MTIGVLGAGQLGRMLALAGFPLGLQFRFLDPASAAPAGRLAECRTETYEEEAALARFAAGVEVITYEFENVPVATARFLERRCPVYPPPSALEVSQDRLVEKTFLNSLGIPTPAFLPVDDDPRHDPQAAAAALGLPVVLKTRRMGYDGKGQAVVRTASEVPHAFQALGGQALIMEAFAPFTRELSLLSARGRDGEKAFYPLVENHHREGILRLSLAPAPDLPAELQAEAEAYATRVLEALNYVGILAIEFFQVQGRLLVNEIAPRVHNSGHWSIEGAETSQFENHLRAILGLPLGSTAMVGCCAMLNLIGDLPDTAEVLRRRDAHLHLYDKSPRPGRKIGHITLRAPDRDTLDRERASLQQALNSIAEGCAPSRSPAAVLRGLPCV